MLHTPPTPAPLSRPPYQGDKVIIDGIPLGLGAPWDMAVSFPIGIRGEQFGHYLMLSIEHPGGESFTWERTFVIIHPSHAQRGGEAGVLKLYAPDHSDRRVLQPYLNDLLLFINSCNCSQWITEPKLREIKVVKEAPNQDWEHF